MCEKKFIVATEILEQKELIEDVFSIRVKYPHDLTEKIKPGNFVNIYLDRRDLLLPRPISICRADENNIRLVYKVVGAGTRELSGYGAGKRIKLTVPLGNGYEIPSQMREVWVVGGGLGIPPLLELTGKLKETGCFVNVILGYRDRPFLTEEFQTFADNLVIISEAEGFGLNGNVMDVLSKELPEKCYASGPLPMLKAVSRYCAEKDAEIQVSLEERMGCGFGACLCCVCKIMENNHQVNKRVCKDGPVFDGRKVVWND